MTQTNRNSCAVCPFDVVFIDSLRCADGMHALLRLTLDH